MTIRTRYSNDFSAWQMSGGGADIEMRMRYSNDSSDWSISGCSSSTSSGAKVAAAFIPVMVASGIIKK
jgi:hypothetical protein